VPARGWTPGPGPHGIRACQRRWRPRMRRVLRGRIMSHTNYRCADCSVVAIGTRTRLPPGWSPAGVEVRCSECSRTRRAAHSQYVNARGRLFSSRERRSLPGRPVTDLTGHRYGRLRVVSFVGTYKDEQRAIWNCICDCGTRHRVRGNALTCGKTTSCGCRRDEILEAGRLKLLIARNERETSK
jgi:hypothetical protein